MKLYPEHLFKMNLEQIHQQKKKMLIIDDDQLFLKSLETIFSTEYDLDLTPDPYIGIEWIKQKKYDVVILDYYMEPINGLETIRLIRKMDHHTGLILLTGYGSYDLAAEAMSLGVSALLSKPVDLHRLKESVQMAVYERYMLDQLYKMDTLTDTALIRHQVLETQQMEIEKLRELLRWTYKQLEATFNIIPVPMMILDTDLRILMLNPTAAAQFKKPQTELIGRYCYEAFGKKGLEECTECPSRHAMTIGLPTQRSFRENDSLSEIMVSAIPIVDDTRQKIIGVVEIRNPDKTCPSYSVKRMMLEAANGKLNEVSEIRHEINNMLTILRSVADVIQTAIDRQMWDRAKVNVPILVENISRMANYLKGLSEKPSVACHTVINVPRFINQLIDTIGSHPLYQPIHFEKSWSVEDIHIKMNESHFQEILINLFKNAAEAKGTKNISIAVDLLAVNQQVSIRIGDDGPGIPEPILPRLFNEKITTKEKGNGYGLLIVKRLIEQNNGTIHLNLSKRGGTEFLLKLPAL